MRAAALLLAAFAAAPAAAWEAELRLAPEWEAAVTFGDADGRAYALDRTGGAIGPWEDSAAYLTEGAPAGLPCGEAGAFYAILDFGRDHAIETVIYAELSRRDADWDVDLYQVELSLDFASAAARLYVGQEGGRFDLVALDCLGPTRLGLEFDFDLPVLLAGGEGPGQQRLTGRVETALPIGAYQDYYR